MFRILSVAIACVALALFSLMARAAEPPKSECPKECELRAKAAFAFAKEKAKAEAKAATTPAPAPAPKAAPEKKVGCLCGDGCQCAPGDCPSKCPVASGIAAVGKLTSAPVPTVEYETWLIDGRWQLVPKGQIPSCLNGRCTQGR